MMENIKAKAIKFDGTKIRGIYYRSIVDIQQVRNHLRSVGVGINRLRVWIISNPQSRDKGHCLLMSNKHLRECQNGKWQGQITA